MRTAFGVALVEDVGDLSGIEDGGAAAGCSPIEDDGAAARLALLGDDCKRFRSSLNSKYLVDLDSIDCRDGPFSQVELPFCDSLIDI